MERHGISGWRIGFFESLNPELDATLPETVCGAWDSDRATGMSDKTIFMPVIGPSQSVLS